MNAKAANTRLGLASAIVSGLPVSALDRLASAVAPHDARLKSRLITKVTLVRRKNSAARRLSGNEGNRLARLAKVDVFTLHVQFAPGGIAPDHCPAAPADLHGPVLTDLINLRPSRLRKTKYRHRQQICRNPHTIPH